MCCVRVGPLACPMECPAGAVRLDEVSPGEELARPIPTQRPRCRESQRMEQSNILFATVFADGRITIRKCGNDET